MSSAAEDIWEKSLNSSDLQKERHREVVFETITEKQNLWSSMVLKDEAGNGDGTESYYKLPLGEVSPEANGTGSIQKNIMVPLLPYNYTTIDNDKFEALPVRKGWVYIFKNDYLWRELEVVERSRLRDVNLTNYQNISRRLATIECDSRIVVPYKVNGKEQKIEVCFAEDQWSWNYINTLGGMDPEDPRLKSYTRMPDGKQLSDSKSRRKKRMQYLSNLSEYINSFSSSPKESDLSNIGKTPNIAFRKLHTPSNLGALFLHDPLGIADSLKRLHLAKVNEIELLGQLNSQTDYPMANLISALSDSEYERVGSDDEIKKEMNQRLANTRLGIATRGGSGSVARWEFLTVDEQEQYVKEYSERYEEEILDFAPIRKVVDLERVKSAKKEIDNHDEKLQKELEELEDDVVKYISETNQKINFESCILDYLEGTSVNFCKGLGRVSFFIEAFSHPSGLEYLKKVSEKGNLIGKILCSKKFVERHQVLVQAMEREDFSDLNLIDDGYKLDTKTILDLSKKASKGLSRFMEGMIKLKIPEGKKGLEWLVGLVTAYLGSDLNLKIHNAELRTLYRPQKIFKPHIYRYIPSLNSKISKAKIHYVRASFKSSKNIGIPAVDLEFIKQNADGAILPFRGIQNLIYMINLGVQVHSISTAKVVTAKDKMAVAYAIVEVVKTSIEIIEAVLKFKHSVILSSADDAAKHANQLVPASKRALRKKISKKHKNWAKQKKILRARMFAQAEIEALAFASKITSWTKITNIAINTMTVLSSILIVSMGIAEYSSAKTAQGKVGAVFKIVGGNMMLVSFSHVRWAISAIRGGTAVATGATLMGTGVATAEFGIGILIFAVGVLVTIVGELFLKESNRPKLLKALDYCYFGKHPYGDGKFADDNPHNRESEFTGVSFSPSSFSLITTVAGMQLKYDYHYNFTDELKVILAALYEYKVRLTIKREGIKAIKEWTDNYIITIEIMYGNYDEGSTELHGNLKLVPVLASAKSIEFPLNEIKMKEFVTCDGQLEKVKYYYLLKKDDLDKYKSIIFSSRLDISGNGERFVPKDSDLVCSLNYITGAMMEQYWQIQGGLKDDGYTAVQFGLIHDYEVADAAVYER